MIKTEEIISEIIKTKRMVLLQGLGVAVPFPYDKMIPMLLDFLEFDVSKNRKPFSLIHDDTDYYSKQERRKVFTIRKIRISDTGETIVVLILTKKFNDLYIRISNRYVNVDGVVLANIMLSITNEILKRNVYCDKVLLYDEV